MPGMYLHVIVLVEWINQVALGVVYSTAADAVASFLFQNKIGVLVENGGKIITTRSARRLGGAD